MRAPPRRHGRFCPVAGRRRLLRKLRLEIAARRDEVVETIVRGNGKPPLDALSGDVLVTLEQMRYYERHAERILRSREDGQAAPALSRGKVSMSTTSRMEWRSSSGRANYPLQLSLVPTITALYAGNAVIRQVL